MGFEIKKKEWNCRNQLYMKLENCIRKTTSEPGVAAHSNKSGPCEAEAAEFSKFKTNLVYRMRLRNTHIF